MATRTALLLTFVVSLITSGLVLSANANERKTAIITFDVPGAVNGTLAIAINPQGTIAGLYIDSVAGHGYVRARDGSFITFDVPGAGPDKGQCESINPAGTITGVYTTGVSPIFVAHGYVRARDGTITTIDVPGAGTGSGQGTFTASTGGLNPAGAIVGGYLDASNVNHGFVRAPDGTFTTFDVPRAGYRLRPGHIARIHQPRGGCHGIHQPCGDCHGSVP